MFALLEQQVAFLQYRRQSSIGAVLQLLGQFRDVVDKTINLTSSFFQAEFGPHVLSSEKTAQKNNKRAK